MLNNKKKALQRHSVKVQTETYEHKYCSMSHGTHAYGFLYVLGVDFMNIFPDLKILYEFLTEFY